MHAQGQAWVQGQPKQLRPWKAGGGSYVRNTSLTCVRPRSILKTGKEFKFQGSVFQTFRITYAKGGSKKWDQTLTDTESTFRKCPNKSHNQAVPEGSPWAVSLWHSTASSPQTPRDESMVYLSYHWLKVWFLSLELNIGLDTNFYWWIFLRLQVAHSTSRWSLLIWVTKKPWIIEFWAQMVPGVIPEPYSPPSPNSFHAYSRHKSLLLPTV